MAISKLKCKLFKIDQIEYFSHEDLPIVIDCLANQLHGQFGESVRMFIQNMIKDWIQEFGLFDIIACDEQLGYFS